MPVQFPDEGSFGAEERVLLSQDIYFGRGWCRYMPQGSILLFVALSNEGPLTRDQLLKWVRPEVKGGKRSWDAPAWDPVGTWTEEEWHRARYEETDGPFAFGPDAPATAAEQNAWEVEAHQEELARSDAYSAALGVAPVRTMGDALEYMVACGVISERFEDGRTVYDLNPDAALPGEVLPLSEAELAAEDHQRWRNIHEPVAQSIIELFKPEEQERIDRKKTSLERLARDLDSDIESVRAGVLNLLADGDFVATVDVEQAEPHKVFELIVDWELFHTKRITLVAFDGED